MEDESVDSVRSMSLAKEIPYKMWVEETGMDAIRAREQSLMREFYEEVIDIPGVRIYGDFVFTCEGICIDFKHSLSCECFVYNISCFLDW